MTSRWTPLWVLLIVAMLLSVLRFVDAQYTSASFRVTKSNIALVSLIGLSVLSIPASVDATNISIIYKAL